MNNVDNIRLLLVGAGLSEDTDLVQKLKNSGFHIYTAASIHTAIDQIRSVHVDMILCDICEKNENGQDILTALKSLDFQENIPLVMIVSEESNPDIKTYCYLAGAADYIVRPFSYKEMLARILNQIKVIQMHRAQNTLYERLKVLEEIAVTDELTGLFNRRYIFERLHHDISHAVRYHEPITFIMLDIDFFKRINDTHGHLAGDQLLKEVANILKQSVRDVDVPARYGGEEFLIACPNTDISGGKIVAERIRKNIENAGIKLNDRDTRTTVSLGVTSKFFIPPVDVKAELRSLISCADTALYRAKMNGRNRIEVYGDNAKCKSAADNSEVINQCTQLLDDYKQ